jgi:hypothetical protein
MRKAFPFIPILLIVIGATMLLDRAHVLAFGWWLILWTLITLSGAYKMYRGFLIPREGGIVWGTIWFFVGLYFVLDELAMIALPGGTLFPAFLVVVGLGFLLALLRQPREWHLAIPALGLLVTGSLMVLAEIDYLGRSVALEVIRQWWPVILVLFGAALLLNRGVARKSAS